LAAISRRNDPAEIAPVPQSSAQPSARCGPGLGSDYRARRPTREPLGWCPFSYGIDIDLRPRARLTPCRKVWRDEPVVTGPSVGPDFRQSSRRQGLRTWRRHGPGAREFCQVFWQPGSPGQVSRSLIDGTCEAELSCCYRCGFAPCAFGELGLANGFFGPGRLGTDGIGVQLTGALVILAPLLVIFASQV